MVCSAVVDAGRAQLDGFAFPCCHRFAGAVVAAHAGASGGGVGVSVEHDAGAVDALDAPECFACGVLADQAGEREAVGLGGGFARDDVGKPECLRAVVGVDVKRDALNAAA